MLYKDHTGNGENAEQSGIKGCVCVYIYIDVRRLYLDITPQKNAESTAKWTMKSKLSLRRELLFVFFLCGSEPSGWRPFDSSATFQCKAWSLMLRGSRQKGA